MLVSLSKNFIFIHIPKTGGNSVNRVLQQYAVIPPRTLLECHIPASVMRSCIRDYNTYFSFSFVRNPFDRLVSLYYFSRKHRAFPATFKEYVELVYRGDYPKSPDQYSKLYNPCGKLLVDFVGKFENIQHDFTHVCNKIGIQPVALPKANATKHPDYKDCYTPELVKYVGELYADDLETFGYEWKD